MWVRKTGNIKDMEDAIKIHRIIFQHSSVHEPSFDDYNSFRHGGTVWKNSAQATVWNTTILVIG